MDKGIHAQRGGGWGDPPKPAKKCIGWVEKREKGKNQAKIGKIRLKIERGKIEEKHQIWLKIGTNG